MYPVYYAFMGLGTTETVSSIGLAMMPPGNVMRMIVDVRAAFWTMAGAASARAWFDFPVIAWLGESIDGAALAGIASRCSFPFELGRLERHRDDAFLRFTNEAGDSAAEIASRLPVASIASSFRPGPFDAGVGCYCATVAPGYEIPRSIFDMVDASPIRAKTYILAQIELRWTPGPHLESSWATLSSARAGGRRR